TPSNESLPQTRVPLHLRTLLVLSASREGCAYPSVLCVKSLLSDHVFHGHFALSPVSNITEDASTSHPCERGAGLRNATSGGWRRNNPTARRKIFRRCVMTLEDQRVSA